MLPCKSHQSPTEALIYNLYQFLSLIDLEGAVVQQMVSLLFGPSYHPNPLLPCLCGPSFPPQWGT